MAKTKKKEAPSARFHADRLKVRVGAFSCTPVAQNDNAAAFHDTAKVTATLSDDELVALLEQMEVQNPGFVRGLPDQITSLPMDGCEYREHKVTFWVSNRKICTIENTTLYGFSIIKGSERSFTLNFSLKGIPSEENHDSFEAMVLDSKVGKFHALSIEPPIQEEMALEEGEEAGDDEEGV